MADTQDEVATRSVEVAKPTISCERKHKFVFNKCCFCVPLRTGCLILAYFLLVGAIVSETYYILEITKLIILMSRFSELSHKYNVTSLVICSINLGITLFAIPFNVLLVIGLQTGKRSFVRRFVSFLLACNILYALEYIVVIIIMGYAHIVNIVIGLLNLVFYAYCTLVMRSQYLKMGATVSGEPVGLYKDGHVVITP